MLLLGMILNACQQSTSKINSQGTSKTIENNTQSSQKTDDKFLITDNAVGHFKIGGSWQGIAQNEYNYKYVQGYGTCIDACCNGGFDLGKDLVSGENEYIQKPELSIGALLFKKCESFDVEKERSKYKNNKDVFFITSDNCSAWYWKDKISFLVVFSEIFKTKEGIGVGTTLEKMKDVFGEVVITIGWLEEDANAISVKVGAYPNLKFIIEADDAIGNYEKLSTLGETAKISDFKKNTKIKRIFIESKNNE